MVAAVERLWLLLPVCLNKLSAWLPSQRRSDGTSTQRRENRSSRVDENCISRHLIPLVPRTGPAAQYVNLIYWHYREADNPGRFQWLEALPIETTTQFILTQQFDLSPGPTACACPAHLSFHLPLLHTALRTVQASSYALL